MCILILRRGVMVQAFTSHPGIDPATCVWNLRAQLLAKLCLSSLDCTALIFEHTVLICCLAPEPYT